MAELNHNVYSDPTLEAMDKAMELKQQLEPSRNYLGASEIGNDCERYLFYSFRNACKRKISAKGIKAIEDGYLQEDVTIARLRALPFIELVNTDGTFDKDGKPNQIGFEMLLGHFRGHCDGMIKGLLQAPKTWHVFEHKSNDKKFNELKKNIADKGEKDALYHTDSTYYAQAQIYMHAFELERHYLVSCLPGGRDHVSCRTEYKRSYAEMLIEKAKNIIFENWTIPAKTSNKREFFKCGWCQFKGICHDGDFPDVHCKTCRYRECVDGGKSMCLATDTIIEDSLLNSGCDKHIYNPALLAAKLIEHQEDGCLYQVEGKDFFFANTNLTGFPDVKGRVDAIFTSKELRENIVNINDITNQFVKEFKGSVIPQEQAKKAWDKANKWEI
jgi:hypothetical protein